MIDTDTDHSSLIQEAQQKISWAHANGMAHLRNTLLKLSLAVQGKPYDRVEADSEVLDKPKVIGDEGSYVRGDPAGTAANERNGAAEGDEFPKPHDVKADAQAEAARAEAKDKTPIVTVVPPAEAAKADA